MMERCADLLRGNMNNKFTIKLCSDLDYEEMVADISYENHTIAMISQDEGIDRMKIVLFIPSGGLMSIDLPLDDFMNAIQFAKKCLIETQKR